MVRAYPAIGPCSSCGVGCGSCLRADCLTSVPAVLSFPLPVGVGWVRTLLLAVDLDWTISARFLGAGPPLPFRPLSVSFPANAKPRRRGYRAAGFWDYVTSYRDSKFGFSVLCRPGSDLLSRVLRQSTIGAEEFNGRVRNGIGFRLLAMTTRPAKHRNWFWFVTDVHSLEGG
jgi:hypothetical protein